MSNIVQFAAQGQLPAAIAQSLAQTGSQLPSALSEGVGSNYANLSFKGKVFRIKYGGQEHHLIDPVNKTPLGYIDLVIVDAKNVLSKTYYASGYTDGATEQPDCASEDGVHPHAPPGKNVQSHDCRTCLWNAFGSKKSNDGIATNSKACADTRKLAVVPIHNIMNENFGGPMLLRVPAASLTNLAEFDRTVRSAGAPFYAVVVRVTFDYTVAYPKLVFTAQRFLTDAEAQDVLKLREDLRTKEIIDGLAPPVAPAAPLPGQVPAAMAPAAQPTPAPVPVATAPVAAPPAAVAPVPVPPVQVAPAPTPAPAPEGNAVVWGTAPAPAPAPVAAAAPPIPQTAPIAAPPAVPQYAPPGVAPVNVPPVAAAPAPAPVPQPASLPQGVLDAVDNLLG